MINISVDYKSLYQIVEGFRDRELSEISNILGKLTNNLVDEILNKLITFVNSNGMITYYDTVLHQKAYSINYPSSSME